VQTPDDGQFEAYLKRFQPVAPEPVPRIDAGRSSRRSLWLGAWLAAVVAVLVIGAVIVHVRSNRVVAPSRSSDDALASGFATSEPLTMRSANAWLATAPSFKAAVDGLAFHTRMNPLPQGKQSAVAVLGKEKIRL
jgi:hypothetical protein